MERQNYGDNNQSTSKTMTKSQRHKDDWCDQNPEMETTEKEGENSGDKGDDEGRRRSQKPETTIIQRGIRRQMEAKIIQ